MKPEVYEVPKPVLTGKPSIVILIAISTVSPVAMNIYLPSLAGMKQAFDATAGQVQMTMSLYFVAVAVAQLFLGPLSDRYGRRPIVLGGMASFVVGTVICLLAGSIETLIGGRIIQAIGGSAGLILARAIVRDLYGRDQAASMIGYVTMGMTAGPMVGPAIGGLLDESFGWSGSFVLLLVLGVIVLIASYLGLYETNKNRGDGEASFSFFKNYGVLLRERLFWAYGLTAMFTATVYFSYLGGAPFVAADVLKISPSEMGIYFMIIAGGYLIGNFISGRFSERFGLMPMIVFGSLFPVVAVLAMIAVLLSGEVTPIRFFAPMFLVGLGNGICLPSIIAGSVSVRPDMAGAASGLTASMQIGMGAFASAGVAWALSESMWPATVWPLAAMMTGAVALTLAGVVAIFVLEKTERR
ncbi:Bcr/CflA subfamily drug resistance transporter [Roseibium sp. TrichSKD4]|uniref:multidrug effflux MFS transporter n=1 Tax=Roseibium sp. TrichSKD4 TaxID=744980 RepID=UPI0001E56FFC|nr:multidrug effflux MFS transporter [Roseibium sp. TrichSKD4]EFO30411.1 Bcr/CflA subfamily drug resistance transporter [Roseibium sp. TrichSKD4]